MVGQHDDWELWLDLLDLSRYECAVKQAQMVLEHNCIDAPRHQKPQAVRTVRRRDQLVSFFSQQSQLRRITVYAKQGPDGSHTRQ